MTAGARPFDGTTEFEVSSAILNDQPPLLPPRLPVALQTRLSADAWRRSRHAAITAPVKCARRSRWFAPLHNRPQSRSRPALVVRLPASCRRWPCSRSSAVCGDLDRVLSSRRYDESIRHAKSLAEVWPGNPMSPFFPGVQLRGQANGRGNQSRLRHGDEGACRLADRPVDWHVCMGVCDGRRDRSGPSSRPAPRTSSGRRLGGPGCRRPAVRGPGRCGSSHRLVSEGPRRTFSAHDLPEGVGHVGSSPRRSTLSGHAATDELSNVVRSPAPDDRRYATRADAAICAAFGSDSSFQQRSISLRAWADGSTPSASPANFASRSASLIGRSMLPTTCSTNLSSVRPSFNVTVARTWSSLIAGSTWP